MDSLQTDIDKFSNYFCSQLTSINELHNQQDLTIIKKLLFVALIDSVGSVAFPKCKKPGPRFRKVVIDFGDWNYASYFSLPHLQQYLREETRPSLANLTRLATARYEPWVDDERSIQELPWIYVPGSRQVISLDADVPEPEVLDAIRDNDIDRKDVERFQHWSLLYKYRNFLVHSFSGPGVNNRPEVLDYPYYEEYQVLDPQTNKGEAYHDLVYPREFLYSLCGKVIRNAAAYFLAERINPYPRMQKSIAFYWVPELNRGIGKLGDRMVSMIRAGQ